MWQRMGNRLISMFTWMLAGYLIGLTIGFTLFDPDLDVWALLSAVLALVGLLLGLLPLFQRRIEWALLAILFFYVSMLVGLILFGDINDDGLLDALQNRTIAALMLFSTAAGFALAYRFNLETYRLPLFGFVFGGFLTPLIVILMVGEEGVSDIGIAPLVIFSGVCWAAVAYWWQNRKNPAIG